MRVVVSKAELRKLRRRMRRAYPKERIEYLWGTLEGDTITISVFDQVKHTATTSTCEADECDHEMSQEAALECGLVLMGTIHSHPSFADAAPSEGDHDYRQDWEIVTGIVGVWRDKGRIRTHVRFYGPTLQLEPVLV